MKNNFRGKHAELGVYDDAMDQEYNEAHRNMLANRSFDTGINIFEDKFWIDGDDGKEFIVPSPDILHDKMTAERQIGLQYMIEEILKLNPLEVLKTNGDKNG